jgi:uncharacterized protein YciI
VYVAILTSKPHTDALRSETKPRHDAYWDKHLDRIKFAGPILSDDGQTRVGQVLLLDVDDRQTAERIVADDPFVQVGLFSSWSIQRFRISVRDGHLA